MDLTPSLVLLLHQRYVSVKDSAAGGKQGGTVLQASYPVQHITPPCLCSCCSLCLYTFPCPLQASVSSSFKIQLWQHLLQKLPLSPAWMRRLCPCTYFYPVTPLVPVTPPLPDCELLEGRGHAGLNLVMQDLPHSRCTINVC